MDFERLARKAQQVYKERGGAAAAKGDASEVEGILKGKGSYAEKAKRAAKALKTPGAAPNGNASANPAPGPTESALGTSEPPPSPR